MKIAFFLDDINSEADYFNEHKPNPGIGGTQFLVWSVSCGLSERNNGLDIILFTNGNAEFPKHIKCIEAQDPLECIIKSSAIKVDYLVLRSPIINKDIYYAIEKYKVKTILWAHNFENYRGLLAGRKSEYVKKNICVSKEQMDLLLDTRLYKRSAVIYNGLWFDEYNYKKDTKSKVICYIGNLYPHSGYELFLKEWNKIQKKHPEYKLVIIGGSNLYNFEVMKHGYSKKGFERISKLEKKYLYEGNKIKDNVKLTGVLKGTEKLKVMSTADVGIANITKAGETFGLGAIEFQGLGVPVVSVDRYGLKETVYNNHTGILVKRHIGIADAVCSLIENESVRRKFSDNAVGYVRKQFSMDKVLMTWELLFKDVEKFDTHKFDINDFKCNEKKLLLMNYRLRKAMKFLPPIMFYKYINHCIRRFFEKLNLY